MSWVHDKSWLGTIALFTLKVNLKNYGCTLTIVICIIINLKEYVSSSVTMHGHTYLFT